MSSQNIYYQISAAHSKMSAINKQIEETMDTRKQEYENITLTLENSKCEHVSTLIELMSEEKKAVESLADLYKETIKMLNTALNDFVEVENNYGTNKIKE